MPDLRRRAKIVCTIGPSSRSETVLRRMIQAGMDVARLNFSHGTHEDHANVVRRIRRVSDEAGRIVAVLQDLQGPKLRVGTIPGDGLHLKRGSPFTLTIRRGIAEPERVSVSYRGLTEDVSRGDAILLDDGLIELRVERIQETEVRCRVITGGRLISQKGINIPGRTLSTPAMTAKDKKDLLFGLEVGVDAVALSFVRQVEDIVKIKRLIARQGSRLPVVAKLEKPQAVKNLEGILENADGIMVARGDLGVEVPPERVPVLQKGMIRQAHMAGKPVITATQMLESMVRNPRPTRAEASDVANAIFDGTDAVMLSAETATGKYPVKTVRMMVRIIKSAERSQSYRLAARRRSDFSQSPSIADSIGLAAARSAGDLEARIISVFTTSGSSALLVSKYRPDTDIYAFTPSVPVARWLRLVWGVHPRILAPLDSTDAMVQATVEQLRAERKVRRGELVVITAGTPVGHPGTTNFLKIHRVD